MSVYLTFDCGASAFIQGRSKTRTIFLSLTVNTVIYYSRCLSLVAVSTLDFAILRFSLFLVI